MMVTGEAMHALPLLLFSQHMVDIYGDASKAELATSYAAVLN